MRAAAIFLTGLSMLYAPPKVDAAGACSVPALLTMPPCERYLIPTDRELLQVRKLFTVMLSNANYGEALPKQWASLGFDWLSTELDGDVIVVLKEQPSRCEGRGLFMFRTAGGNRTLLQIPHRFHDRHTAEIGLRLMRLGDFRGLAWNTVPRHFEGIDAEGVSADLAHSDKNYFAVLAEAAALISADSQVVQLHGYDAKKRRTESGRNSDVIISNGTRYPSRSVHELNTCLDSVFNGPVRLFPRDVRELGATTNQVGSRLRHYTHQGFVHIELNAKARKELLTNDTLLAGMVSCIPGAGR
ncbi:MAG: hypothetical protein KZQ92_17615 [Candidatus Thiodiazotropha sp. (ex Lucinoma borealis)]|nr:hypothetical protein [Candidatus Thiodiazotropha sp. (ex Lucinoma borealis)]MCU7865785.1 hypothetical protein [Candidatus Thiodiazotropha sp. (ex Lucinoma borealis)]MCU7870306.1 hypothetical protein [Candidatus Thiodiazotropha sp. (ex Lucinoma borealis)]